MSDYASGVYVSNTRTRDGIVTCLGCWSTLNDWTGPTNRRHTVQDCLAVVTGRLINLQARIERLEQKGGADVQAG